jgi:hypothetical protein
MTLDSIWTVTINSHAPGVPQWVRRFLKKPTRYAILDVLRQEGSQTQRVDVSSSTEVLADLVSRMPGNYADTAINGRGYIIYAARVEIGCVGLRELEIYRHE